VGLYITALEGMLSLEEAAFLSSDGGFEQEIFLISAGSSGKLIDLGFD
jgi:hypothetical protein